MARENDHFSRKRADQLREAIKYSIYSKWLGEAGEPTEVKVTKSEHQGATNAMIFKADVRITFHIKDSLSDAQKEKKGYNILRKQWGKHKSHLVPPLFKNVKGLDSIMLVPYQNAATIHALIADQEGSDWWIKKFYEDFLKALEELWVQSKSPDKSCNVIQIYRRRITARNAVLKAKWGKSRINNLKVSINGKQYGSLGDRLEKFSYHLDKLKAVNSCTIHGDEHANNVMVYNDAINLDAAGWVIIDYVNVMKNGDWIFSIAKMIQWWQFYYVLEVAKSEAAVRNELLGKHKIRGGELELSYDEDVLNRRTPAICRQLEKRVMEFAGKVGKLFEEEQSSWQERLKLALFAIIFGSMPFHIKEVDFAVPIMIHKSFEWLDKL